MKSNMTFKGKLYSLHHKVYEKIHILQRKITVGMYIRGRKKTPTNSEINNSRNTKLVSFNQ